MMYTRDCETEPTAGERDYAEPSSSEILAFEQHAGQVDNKITLLDVLLCGTFVIACLLAFLPLAALAIVTLGLRTILCRIGTIKLPGILYWDEK